MTVCESCQMNSKCIKLSCLPLRIISCILVTNEKRDGAKAKINGEEIKEFIVFYVRVTVHHNKFPCNKTN
jgi:hypothetical protein